MGFVASCGPSTTTTPPEKVSVDVTASKGGVVASKDGKASLNIPASALGKDTTITLEISAPANGSVTDVLDFGPTGTKFSTPATLDVAVDASKLVSGKKFSLAVEENGKWVAIAGSTYANGKVSGPVDHFSKYTIVLIDGMAVLMSQCQSEIDAYQACGGDPVGTWSVADYCLRSRTLGPDPFEGKCPNFVGSIDLKIAGDFTITSTTTQFGEISSSVTFGYKVPLTCFNNLDAGFYLKDCAELQAVMSKKDGGTQGTCAVVGSVCDSALTEQQGTQPAQMAKPFKYSGSNFIEEDGGIGKGSFCVKNNKLYVSTPEADGGGNLVIFNKK